MKKIVILFFMMSILAINLGCSKLSNVEAIASEAADYTNEANSDKKVEIEVNETEKENSKMKIQVGENFLTATLAENSSAEALKELLAEGPVTIDMRDYGNMEKVGSIGKKLPTNDESITTEAGDLILYQGSAFVIYYAPNSWSFTRLGKIDGTTAEELIKILGKGNVKVTLSLE